MKGMQKSFAVCFVAIMFLSTILALLPSVVPVHADVTYGVQLQQTNSRYSLDFFGQRHIIYGADGYWYAFYAWGTGLYYQSSPDGAGWSGATFIRTLGGSGYGQRFAVAYDNATNRLAYVIATETNGAPLYFRLGECVAGSISWLGSEQNAQPSIANIYMYPSMAFDSSGHAWITYWQGFVALKVIKNNNTNATWTTAVGFPKSFGLVGIAPAEICPLLSNQMYFVYPYWNSTDGTFDVRGRLYDGTLESEEVITSTISLYWRLLRYLNFQLPECCCRSLRLSEQHDQCSATG